MKIFKSQNKKVFDAIIEYTKQMSIIQNAIITYLDEDDDDSNYEILLKTITDSKIQADKNQMKSFFHLLLCIFNDHNRSTNFLMKIDKIINTYKNKLFELFTYDEIFSLFRQNKRFALTLFSKQANGDHLDTEILKLLHIDNDDKLEAADFEQKVKNGENEEYICSLMRDDNIDDFIVHIEKKNLSRNTMIYPTEFESHLYLKKNRPSLIEYSSFFGSFQIFKYLEIKKVKMNPNLWKTVIHGRNNELIHILEENHIDPPNKTYQSCVDEAIKCHHYDYYDYIKTNLVDEFDSESSLVASIESFNFDVMNRLLEEIVDKPVITNDIFAALLANDHPYFVELLINSGLVDVNCILKKLDNGRTEMTPLYIAINKGSFEMVKFLLEKENINIKQTVIRNCFVFE